MQCTLHTLTLLFGFFFSSHVPQMLRLPVGVAGPDKTAKRKRVLHKMRSW